MEVLKEGYDTEKRYPVYGIFENVGVYRVLSGDAVSAGAGERRGGEKAQSHCMAGAF